MRRLATPEDVISFWRDAGQDRWFSKDEAFDQACRERFMHTHEAAARGDLNKTDPVALMTADRAIERGYDGRVEPQFRRFFYLPFMHSESLRHQERSVALNEALGEEECIKWARHHHDILARFGRFPHR